SLEAAKKRLAPLLNPLERRAFALAMLEDVLYALSGGAGVEAVVVSSDPEVRARAVALAARALDEGPADIGLNSAITLAAQHLRTPDIPLMVVAADLPLLTPAAVDAFVRAGLDSGSRGPLVAVSRDGKGTNAIFVPGSVPFAPAFGTASAASHLNLPGASAWRDPAFALDVDTPADLAVLLASEHEGSSVALAGELRLAQRLARGGWTADPAS
ncbi:MAG: 2-phospho-L-lactate guanylyltransferase, partial [Actinomycetota bacterium]